MSHQVSPTSFRRGKVNFWNNNIISPGPRALEPISATQKQDIIKLLKYKLRRKRFFVVKAVITHMLTSGGTRINLLYMPRIKSRPKSESLGNFSRNVLYKPFNWASAPFLVRTAKKYVDERRLKIFKFPRAKKKNKINKWLTRRMLRGSFRLKKINNKRYKHAFIGYYYKFNKLRNKRWKRRLNRWFLSRAKIKAVFNSYRLSHAISNFLNQKIIIKSFNVFSYLAKKQMIGYRSHQEHFWHRRYRHYRFSYDNYYDIVNSIFILGLIRNSEKVLLDILRMMMPRIRKIRRFMYFLDAVLKNMAQIRKNFACFRITLTGKIRGGTQRTKTMTVGYGYFPYQSINLEGAEAFVSYKHKFG